MVQPFLRKVLEKLQAIEYKKQLDLLEVISDSFYEATSTIDPFYFRNLHVAEFSTDGREKSFCAVAIPKMFLL